jgi:probable HAF family extracellular repeat protein
MILSIRIVLAGAALLSTTAYAATQYRVVDTGIADANHVYVRGMNDKGDLVGFRYHADFEEEAYVYDYSSRSVIDLPSAGAGLTFQGSEASEINERGAIVGLTTVPGMNGWHGVRWDMNGGFELLPGIRLAYGIDRRGRIVGEDENSRAVMWVNGRIVDLGLPDIGRAHSISDTGFVTGVRQDVNQAFLYRHGESEAIDVLNAESHVGMDAAAVNNFGEVVGSSGAEPVPGPFGEFIYPTHAFLYRDGELEDLGTLSSDPTASSYARGINDTHEVVGALLLPESHGLQEPFTAFLYKHGEMRDLNTLIEPSDPLAGEIQLFWAADINCRGWIAAEGQNRTTGMYGAYLLIPKHAAKHPHSCIR